MIAVALPRDVVILLEIVASQHCRTIGQLAGEILEAVSTDFYEQRKAQTIVFSGEVAL